MLVYLNGKFVPEEKALVSVFDRSFMYGDGLFETVRIFQGRPCFWVAHGWRMEDAAKCHGFEMAVDWIELGFLAMELAKRNGIVEGALRVHLSRGVGKRGYSPAGIENPALVMTVGPLTHEGFDHPPVTAHICNAVRLPWNDEVAQFKTAAKFAQVVARQEAERAGAQESILLNSADRVVECSSGNIFLRVGKELWTPPLVEGPVQGIVRSAMVSILTNAGVAMFEREIFVGDLERADAILRTSTIGGITVIRKVKGLKIRAPKPPSMLKGFFEKMVVADHAMPW